MAKHINSKREYTEGIFDTPCFMCHHRTKKVYNFATFGIYLCSEKCVEDYKKFVEEELKK